MPPTKLESARGNRTADAPPVIGCSLPTGFVADRPPHHGQAADWAAMYGTGDTCLAALAERGVRSVELRDVRARTPLDDVARAIAKVRAHGLAVTLHLWLPHDVAELEGVLRLADRALADAAAPVACALHPHYLTFGAARADALRNTAEALAALADALASAGSPLLPALELCRQRAGGPVGTTFDEVLAMRRAVDAPRVGLCWDVGHGFANHRAGLVPLEPDDAFVAEVVHTHLHDLDARGATHGPLVAPHDDGAVGGGGDPVGRALAADAVRRLVRAGYRGVYDLELETGRWPIDATARRRAVEASVDVLAGVLAEGAP
jgi:sugar phosphate isomerase/epimerase